MKGALLKNIILQKQNATVSFTKISPGSQGYNSSYQNFILSSGLKFNKIEIDINLKKKIVIVLFIWIMFR